MVFCLHGEAVQWDVHGPGCVGRLGWQFVSTEGGWQQRSACCRVLAEQEGCAALPKLCYRSTPPLVVSLSIVHRREVGAAQAVCVSQKAAGIYLWCFTLVPSTSLVFALPAGVLAAGAQTCAVHSSWSGEPGAGRGAAVWGQQRLSSSRLCTILGTGSGTLVLFCWVWWAAMESKSIQRNSKLNLCFQETIVVPALSPCLSLALTHSWLQHWEPGWALFFMLL